MTSRGRSRFGMLGTWVAIVYMAIVLAGCTCRYTEQAWPVDHCLPPDCCGVSPYWGGQVLAPDWGPAPNVPYPPRSTGKAVNPAHAPEAFPVHVDGQKPPTPRPPPPYVLRCACLVNQTTEPVKGELLVHCVDGTTRKIPIPPIGPGKLDCWPLPEGCALFGLEANLDKCQSKCAPMPPMPVGPVSVVVCVQGGGVIGPVVCDCVFAPGGCPRDPRSVCPEYRPR